MRVLIIGAGIAGLVSALFLTDIKDIHLTIMDVESDGMMGCSASSGATALWSQSFPASMWSTGNKD